jgi:integrase/recombinase XerC
MATFLFTAARLSEVCDLNNGSLTGRKGDWTLTIIGKGGKRRQVAVHSAAGSGHRGVPRLGSVRRGRVAGRSRPAAGGVGRHAADHQPGAVPGVEAVPQTGLEAQRSPGALVHALRHTVAVQLVEKGVPTPAVQEFLGHASQDTTMQYVRKVARDQQRILDALT